MGSFAWRPPFPEALRGKETVNSPVQSGRGRLVNRLSRATEASLLTRLGMVTGIHWPNEHKREWNKVTLPPGRAS